MPEGDTLFRTAAQLRLVLAGAPLTRVAAASSELLASLAAAPAVGRRIEAVEARGKHLLVLLDDGRALRTHLRMTGSWHLYRAGESWKRPASQARLALEVPGWVAVCFNAPEVELIPAEDLPRHARLARLGPDLTADGPDLEEGLRRLRSLPDDPLGVALLRQDVVAGIGNVFKSEVLFLERLDPFATVSAFDRAELAGALGQARALLARNREGGPRTTRGEPGPRLWVYGRSGLPCLRCGAAIAMRRQGDQGRSTYHCASCQPPRTARPEASAAVEAAAG